MFTPFKLLLLASNFVYHWKFIQYLRYERIKDILNPWPPFFPDLPPGHLTLPDLPPPIVNENLGFLQIGKVHMYRPVYIFFSLNNLITLD